VIFQTGSTYSQQTNSAPSLSGRVYANFEVDGNINFTSTSAVSNGWTVDNIEVKNGSSFSFIPNSSAGTIVIKGNITIAGDFTIGRSGTSSAVISLNGANQFINGTSGLVTFSAPVTLENSANVTLTRDIDMTTLFMTVKGTLDCGSNSISGVNGSFFLNSGATLKTSSTNGINGSVLTTNKTFSNNANYCFNGSTSTPFSIGVASVTANNLQINSCVTLNKDIIVNGKLSLQNGSLSIGVNSLTYGSSSTLEYNGSISAQTTSNSEFPSLNGPASLLINNPFGVTLHSGRTLTGTLSLASGILTTTNLNLLTIDAAGTVSGGSPVSFVNGPLAKNTNSISSFSFPVGKGSTYKPVGIIPANSNATTFTAEFFNTCYPNTTSIGAGISVISCIDYFILDRSGSSPADSRVVLSWNSDNGILNPGDLRVAHWNGSVWQNEGNAGTTGSLASGTITSDMVASFSPFALASATLNNPLPVLINKFSSEISGRNVILHWSTSGEINNRCFEIERTSQNNLWLKISSVNSKGNAHSSADYFFEDKNLETGKYKYRLKQIDLNGNYNYFELSNPVEIGVPLKFHLYQNYPNPFNPVTKIDYDLPADSRVDITVYDMLGREIVYIISNQFTKAGFHTAEFNAAGLSMEYIFTVLLRAQIQVNILPHLKKWLWLNNSFPG
jgi:hypothetical protein